MKTVTVEMVEQAMQKCIDQGGRAFDETVQMCAYLAPDTERRCVAGHVFEGIFSARMMSELVDDYQGSADEVIRDVLNETDDWVDEDARFSGEFLDMAQAVHDWSCVTDDARREKQRFNEYLQSLKKFGVDIESQVWQDWRTLRFQQEGITDA